MRLTCSAPLNPLPGLLLPYALVAAGLLALLAAPAAIAQSKAPQLPPPGQPPAPAQAPAAPSTVLPEVARDLDLVSDPIRIESVGLSMSPPLKASVTSGQFGALTRVSIKDDDLRWLINIENPRSENAEMTLAQVADKTLKDILLANAIVDKASGEKVGANGKILSRIKDLRVPGVGEPGERFYVAIPQGGAVRVEGYTLFRISPGQFVAIQLICGQEDLKNAQRIYETAVATLKIQDPTQADSLRRDAIAAGRTFLSRLTPADYDAASAQPAQLYRLYRPAPSGAPGDAEERGYRSVRFFKGVRTQIDPKTKDDRPGPGNPSGHLAEISARLVDRSPLGDTVITDVQGFYFMSNDRNDEAWSIRMARHESQTRAPSVFTETGTRSGRVMTVIVEKPGKSQPTVRPTVPPDGYINQVEVFMLPRLLQRAGAEADMGFYGYQSLTENVTLRRDSASRDELMPGVWRITSRPRESAEPTSYLFRESGELIRAELPDGLIMEPIWPAELEKLWKAKGLPTGAFAQKPEKRKTK